MTPSPARVALAWLLLRRSGIVSIPDTCNLSRVCENPGSIDLMLTAHRLESVAGRSSRWQS